MATSQIRRTRQSATLPQTSARHVREMLLEIAFHLHATKVVKRPAEKDSRRRPVSNCHCFAS